MKVLEWPSQPPDLNITEHLSGDKRSSAYKKTYIKNTSELVGFCKEEWGGGSLKLE